MKNLSYIFSVLLLIFLSNIAIAQELSNVPAVKPGAWLLVHQDGDRQRMCVDEKRAKYFLKIREEASAYGADCKIKESLKKKKFITRVVCNDSAGKGVIKNTIITEGDFNQKFTVTNSGGNITRTRNRGTSVTESKMTLTYQGKCKAGEKNYPF